ncbi:SDR family oxidoreductase [Oceanicoccus sagamiensis]|uniref:Short-chain dehydrogenase n=1 Tax=Oceanicoccus sagamiensis TaxID=716816 RepID=A0A1X9NIP7_9GAMM|nr:SDR family oxidoreductase [Oceanicoccus sagamiensis]ARN75715.1 short-chain dehydrogenase [Oceanicoccus sagamiensis]
MDLGIAGKKALVNGGSAGLGKGSAKALAREGVELYISARGEERLLATAEEIRAETGATVIPIVADHASDAGRDAILSIIPDPDILVGTCSPAPFSPDFRKVTVAEWQEHLAVGLISPVEFMRATIDGMCERGFGRVVNISTAASKFPAELRALSGPPRAALSNYSVAISKAVAKYNVCVNNLLPGMHHTATAHERFSKMGEEQGISYDQVVQDWIDEWGIPTNTFGDIDDFGAICAMLCSQQANYIIGQNLVIDGGVTNSTF